MTSPGRHCAPTLPAPPLAPPHAPAERPRPPRAADAGGLLGSGFAADKPASVAAAIAVMCSIVAFHEFGHFYAARSLGIHVTAFSIGFGPKVLGFEGKDGVEYKLSLFPLGGYVAFPDEEPEPEEGGEAAPAAGEAAPAAAGGKERRVYDRDDPDLLNNRPTADRFIVTVAGIVANVVFAYGVLFAQASTVGIAQAEYRPGVAVPSVVKGSPGEAAGVRAGDVITAIGGVPLPASERAPRVMIARVQNSPGRPLPLQVERGGQTVELTVVPSGAEPGAGRIGVQLAPNAEARYVRADNPVQGAALASFELSRMAGAIAGGLSQLFTNFSQSSNQLAGPVAIVAAGSEIVRRDASGLWQFAAIINLNLAAVNALPLPGLDGGYLAVQAVEAARGGRRLPKEVVGTIMSSGFLLLTGMGLVLIVRDTLNLTGL